MEPPLTDLRKKPVRISAPLREQVLDILREEIAAGKIPPGRRLIERELVDLTGTSRTTIREVLQHLVAEGLAVPVRPRGVAVVAPTPKSIAELYEVRALLEGIVARDFVLHALPREVEELGRCVADLKNAAADPARMISVKDQFYDLLCKGSGNQTVRTLLETLHTRIAVTRAASLRAPGRPSESVAEISELLAAIERRDADQASRLAMVHVRRAASAALSQFTYSERTEQDGTRPNLQDNAAIVTERS
jgi:GntR family transcriptional regulator, trigonelline degradation regulator